MGSCMRKMSKQPGQGNTSIVHPDPAGLRGVNGALLPVGEERKEPASTRKQQAKKRAPVADNRLRQVETLDAPTATITVRDKTPKEHEEIKRVISSHFLLHYLSNEDLELVIDEMYHFAIEPHELVFSQGQPGHFFFVIASGKVEIIVNNRVRGHLSKGHCFGEIALIHDSKRTATIRTVEKTHLWGIDRNRFTNAMQKIKEKKYEENKDFVESVSLFSMLTPEQRNDLLSIFVTQEFTNGQKIVVEGDPGNLFYIIKEGEVRCSRMGIEIRQMGKGDFFGEQALLYNTERTATVTALGNTRVLSLGREDLITVLGDQLQHIIYKNSQRIALEEHSALKILNKEQIDEIIGLMTVESYGPGETVIREGTLRGEKMWIVLKGELRGGNNDVSLFKCIGDKDLIQTPEGIFAERYVAKVQSDVSVITRDKVERCLGGPLKNISSKNEVVDILRKVPLLRALPYQTIERLVSVLRLQEYEAQQTIFTEGDPGNSFYIVKEGQVEIVKGQAIIRTIVQHDYFGERSILLNENRTATVVTKGKAIFWVLNKEDFLNLVEEGIRTQLLKRIELQNDRVTLEELKFVKVLGKGMFGNVFLTVHQSKDIKYALKTVQRSKISAYDIYENLVLERQILLQLDHPFVMKLVKTFKDQKRLYFLMEYVRGMDLFDVLRVLNLLNNDYTKFYAGCMMLILEHLHERQIIYRDLKPENIMVDEEGYLKLIDFGTAKILQGRTYTVVGTPHYMAPEVIVGKGYTLSADYWSVGIMIYEFICGCVPFGEEEEDPFRIYEKVLERRLVYPSYVNPNFRAKPIVEQLLSKNASMRGTYKTIKEHTWFSPLDWDKLLGKMLEPPYIPQVTNLNTEINAALKKTATLHDSIDKEEIKDAVDVPRHKMKPPPAGWDEKF